jgi:hypothetical protein
MLPYKYYTWKMSRNNHISLKSEGRFWNKSLRASDMKRVLKINSRPASRLLGINNKEIGFVIIADL